MVSINLGVCVQLYQAFNKHAVAQIGIGVTLFSTPTFWLSILLVYIITCSYRVIERGIHHLHNPTDIDILAENETLELRNGGPMSQQGRGPEEIELQGQRNGESGFGRNISAAENGDYSSHSPQTPQSSPQTPQSAQGIKHYGSTEKLKISERDSSDKDWLHA